MPGRVPAGEALTEALLEFRRQGGQRHHAPGELGRAEGLVLMVLSELDPEAPGLRVSDLAREIEVSPSTLTQTTTSLFRLGYIVRESDPHDRRVIRIRLTSLGRSMVTKHMDEFRAYCGRIAEYLGERDSLAFARLLRKVSGFMESEPRPTRVNPPAQGPGSQKAKKK